MSPISLSSFSRRYALDARQDPPSAVATPQPTQTHTTSNVPTINGSEGAFIGLVVALSLIFVAACVAIFLLLRYNEPSPSERTRRRKYSIRRPGVAHPIPIGLRDFDSDDAGGTIKEKLRNMFRNGHRGESGWVQASGDDWDTGDDDVFLEGRKEMVDRRAEVVHSVGGGSAGNGLAASPSGTPYEDPFGEQSSARVHAPLSPPSPAFELDGGSLSHTSKSLDVEGHLSMGSLQTFAGGTKFKENV